MPVRRGALSKIRRYAHGWSANIGHQGSLPASAERWNQVRGEGALVIPTEASRSG
jgi:hypothetical protein